MDGIYQWLTESLELQSWANIYSMEITSEECLMGVKHLLSCPSTINTVRGFQGQEAQMFADFLDRVSRPNVACFHDL